MKLCKQCGKEQPESQFFKSTKTADGLQYECRSCSRERTRAARLRHRANGILTYSQRTQQRLKREVLCAYSANDPKCDCCGEAHIEFLSVDHVDGKGARHRKHLRKSGTGFYHWLKANGFPLGFRVLCHNCNQSLGHYGYCPHKNPERTPSLERIKLVPPKQSCKRGHPFDEKNTVLRDGVRRCRTCMNFRIREWKRRQRAARKLHEKPC